ncbi:MAG: hypothetical protein MN733_28385 [Nitrososphaera sp.]|nr:hypothetical protein [Nitrososphaera sp.]
MNDQQAKEVLSIAQSILNEIGGGARATRALLLEDGVGICIKVSAAMWTDRQLMEGLSQKIQAIKGVSAVYVEI